MNSVEINNLTKTYGKHVALNNVSLRVPAGSIFGLLGPNGAGKTTLIKAMVGGLKLNSGSVAVLGKDPLQNRWELRRQIGYMPQSASLYEDLSARQNITFFGKAQNIQNLDSEVEKILAFTELSHRADEPVRNFSGGMQKRVSLACTLIHSPRLLFLDEPTAAVDPHLKKRTWQLFRQLAEQGVTIFVSTHLMDEALLCHHLAVLRLGEVLATDTPQNFVGRGKTKIKYLQNGTPAELMSQSDPASLAASLHALGLQNNISELRLEQDTIEDIILEIVKEQAT